MNLSGDFSPLCVLTRKLEEIGSKKLSLLLAVKNGLDRCANSFVTLSKSIKEPEPEIELWRGPIQVFFCKKSIADLFSILKMQLNLAESIILLYNMFNFSKASYVTIVDFELSLFFLQ